MWEFEVIHNPFANLDRQRPGSERGVTLRCRHRGERAKTNAIWVGFLDIITVEERRGKSQCSRQRSNGFVGRRVFASLIHGKTRGGQVRRLANGKRLNPSSPSL